MLVQRHWNVSRPSSLQLASAGLQGTTQTVNLSRLWPVEEIVIRVVFHVNTAISAGSATAGVSAVENLLAVLKRVRLSGSYNSSPKTIVDYSGPGLLEYAGQVGINLDRSTNWLIGACNQFYNGGGTVVTIPTGTYQITYRIPLVNPLIGEPLRMRTLVPFHLFDNDPSLILDFASAAEMYATGAIDKMFAEVTLIQADWNTQREAVLQKAGGWILSDLIETPFGIAPGVSTEQRIAVPIGGSYTNLLFRQYLGGTNLTRQVVDFSGIGDTFANGAGNEQLWRLEIANFVMRQWTWRQMQVINDWTRIAPTTPVTQFAAVTSAGSPTTAFIGAPNPGGIINSSTNVQPGASTMIDFLGDGVTGDTTTDLGSTLNANVANGVKVEVIGTPTSVATNGSIIYVGGHRLFGDLSSLKAMP